MTRTFNSKKHGVITVTRKVIMDSTALRALKHHFTITTGQSLTREEQQIIQQNLGYHPCGYGYNYISGTEWSCWSSCD